MFDFLKKQAQRPAPALAEGTIRRRFLVRGRVQGVGFRYRAQHAAQTLGLTGWVRNLDDGSVELEAQGQPDAIGRLLPMIEASQYIRIEDIDVEDIAPDPWARSFSVRGY